MSESIPAIQRLRERFPDQVRDLTAFDGDAVVSVPADRAYDVLEFLKDDPELQFHMLVDLCGVDYAERPERFEVVYTVRSFKVGRHLRLRAALPSANPAIRSVTPLFKAADWCEREAYDMFGIVFEGHPNLRRILTHEEFVGHPLRKDYASTERHKCTTSIELD